MDKSSKNEQTPEESMDETQQAHIDELETEESGTTAESVTPDEGNGESSLPHESVEENQSNEEETLDKEETPQQEPEETEQTAGIVDEESGTSDLDNESMPDMDALYNDSLKAFDEGEIVVGHIVNITSDEVMIDIGF